MNHRKIVPAAAALVLVAALAQPAVAVAAVPAVDSPGRTVTLVTGDRVSLTPGGGVSVTPRAGRAGIPMLTSTVAGRVRVIPADALPLLRDLGKLWSTVSRKGATGKIWLDAVGHFSGAEGIQQIGVPAAWRAGATGTGMTVALVDSGVDVTHPARRAGGPYCDSAGHPGYFDQSQDTLAGTTTLYRDGAEVASSDVPGRALFTVRPTRGAYRLNVDSTRAASFELSTHVTAYRVHRPDHGRRHGGDRAGLLRRRRHLAPRLGEPHRQRHFRGPAQAPGRGRLCFAEGPGHRRHRHPCRDDHPRVPDRLLSGPAMCSSP